MIEALEKIDIHKLPEDQQNVVKSTLEVLQKRRILRLRRALEVSVRSILQLKQSSEDIAAASEKVNTATQDALKNSDEYRKSFTTNTYPVINEGMIKLSAATSELSAAISNQQLLVDQTSTVLDQLISALGTTSTALGQTDDLLASFQSSISVMQTDVEALTTSTALSSIMGDNGVDPENIADFMLSPTQLKTESLYSVNAYGSAMAPLFMNMTLWIGAFMLLVILRQEDPR